MAKNDQAPKGPFVHVEVDDANRPTGGIHCGHCCDRREAAKRSADAAGAQVGWSRAYGDGWEATFGGGGAGGMVN